MSPDSYDPRISATARGDDSLPSLPGYEILETIGRGEIGVVYKALQLRLDRPVAIKALLFDSYLDDRSKRMIARFLDEARALGRIGAHENIVQVHDIVADREGNDYIVMELIEGPTLAERMEKGPPLSMREALKLARGAARGLGRAHKAGVVHRDVKPANIMIDAETGAAKLVDFGVARVQGAKSRTGTSERLGAPLYASPEQMERDSDVDGRSDIYSLAATLYHLVCGRPPFQAKSAIELMEKRLRDEPPKPSAVTPEIDPKLEEIILKGMARRASDRYQKADEMGDALDRLIHSGSDSKLGAALPAATPSGEQASLVAPVTRTKHEASGGKKKGSDAKGAGKPASSSVRADDPWGRRLRLATTAFVGWMLPSLIWIFYTAIASGHKTAAEEFRAYHHAIIKLVPGFLWSPFEAVIEGMSSPAPGKWVAIFVVFHATFLPTLLYVARWSLFRWRDSSRRHRALAWTSLSILAVLGALDHFAWLFWMDRFDKTLWAGTQIFILVPFAFFLCRAVVKWPKAPISALLAVLYFPAVVVETLGFAWTQGLLSVMMPLGVHASLLFFAKDKLAGGDPAAA